MLLDDKPFEQLTSEDILALIPGVSEGRRIDYKQALPDDREKSIRSFLNDVSALANSAGGYLVYGVEEEKDEDGSNTGVPSAVCGVGQVNFDQAQLAWEQRVKQNIEPTIIGYRVRFIEGFADGAVVMVVFVPRSLLAPHWTNYAGKREFRVRHDRGNQLMELDEIRHSFIEARQIPERIDEFVRLRASKVLAGQTPVSLLGGRSTVIHLVPISALQPDPPLFDTASLDSLSDRILGFDLGATRPNFNGRLFHAYQHNGVSRCYMQVYRDGRIEIASRSDLAREQALAASNTADFFLAPKLEQGIVQSIVAALTVLTSLRVPQPVYACLTLLGVKGRILLPHGDIQNYDVEDLPTFDEDMLFMPSAVFESSSDDVSKVMRPVFDVLWQSAGWQGSMSYDADGNWSPRV
jgi:hypothetical protein